MKVAVIIAFSFIMLVVSKASVAQVINVPDKAKKDMAQRYPKAEDIKWSNNVTNYTAQFALKGKTYEAHYVIDGTWDNTETKVENDDLPKDVRKAFEKSRFADWEILSTDYVVDNKNNNVYRYNLKKGIEKKYLYLDKDGKEIKTNTGL